MPEPQRRALLAELTDDEAEALLFDWRFWARREQIEPAGDWTTWLLSAGRGFGKTRSGAEWVREQVDVAMEPLRIALIAKTPADARDVMIEGESGLLAISPPWNMPEYEPSKRRLTWPNGSMASVYSSKEFDTLRGPQHHIGWADELGVWHYPKQTWDNFMLGLRLGTKPRAVVTTTPRRIPLIVDLIERNGRDVAVTGGSTFDNAANLPDAFFDHIVSRYEGTALGQQELYARLLTDVPGALWQRATIEELRVVKAPELVRIVVAVDPSGSSKETAAECGIVAAGLGVDGHGYVLDDATRRCSPIQWARATVTLYHKLKADRIVAESNYGGEMVELTIETVDPKVPVTLVHASRGKQIRAEPISALYEQGRVHHLGMFGPLEDELCTWVPDGKMPSPNRLDACVWALTALMVTPESYRRPGDLGIY